MFSTFNKEEIFKYKLMNQESVKGYAFDYKSFKLIIMFKDSTFTNINARKFITFDLEHHKKFGYSMVTD